MSRAKPTTGEAIAFRLPLAEDVIFREKAKENGMSPGQYARKLIV